MRFGDEISNEILNKILRQDFETRFRDEILRPDFETRFRDNISSQDFKTRFRDKITRRDFETRLWDKILRRHFETRFRDTGYREENSRWDVETETHWDWEIWWMSRPRLIETGKINRCRDRDQSRLGKRCRYPDSIETLAHLWVSLPQELDRHTFRIYRAFRRG